MEAIAGGNREEFNKLRPSIVATIESYKQRVAALRQAYQTTTQRRENAEEALEKVHAEGYTWVFDHQGPPNYDPPLALQAFQIPPDDALTWQQGFQNGKKSMEDIKEEIGHLDKVKGKGKGKDLAEELGLDEEGLDDDSMG